MFVSASTGKIMNEFFQKRFTPQEHIATTWMTSECFATVRADRYKSLFNVSYIKI
jgi:hypothetical protein